MQTLAAQGVKDIFALSGNQIMPLFDASLDAGIRLYHTRHEAAAVYMAEGYAQIAGGVGVALVTAGAGLGNAIATLLTARTSDTPVVLLSGDSPAAQDGKGAFQEMDQVALTRSLTKWSVRPTQPEELARTIHEAMRVAQEGRPGPVHVSLPADLLAAESRAVQAQAVASPDTPDTGALRDFLAGTERPVIILGPALNATRAPGLAERLKAATGAPVIVMESPRGIADPSLGAAGPVIAEADRIALLGKPLDFTLRFGEAAPGADWAIVTADAAEIARARRNVGARLALEIEGDARACAEALCAWTDQAPISGWAARLHAACNRRMVSCGTKTVIDPGMLCASVDAALQSVPNPVLICDGGEFGQWAQAGITAPRRIVNGVSGAIGGGLCYAMGARAADRQATVIAMMGDGTAGFHLAEFETALREDLPFVAVIGNDRRWNAEHQIQMRDFGADRVHGCALSGARYDLAVAALGGFGAHVSDPADLPNALASALSSGKPACIDVEIEGHPAPLPD
ncbi:thiamine pyrophosphate-binding protein [Marivita sp. GX14005]|nr:thiamine pyrophosphate-binding protein [Marivita sp. GX14005]